MTKDTPDDDGLGLPTFDQTNGVVDGLDGYSDGSAESGAGSHRSDHSIAPMPLNRIGAYQQFGITGEAVDAAGRPQHVRRKGFSPAE